MFLSGVSNSLEKQSNEFTRELELIKSCMNNYENKKFIYFITSSIETTICVLQLAGLSPGNYVLGVTVIGNDNIIAWTSEWDLQLSKQSQPPVLTISSGDWVDSNSDDLVDKYTLTGSFNDPDGEDVTFTITLNGQTAGSITTSGTTWSSAPIPFDLYPEGEHNITITACDESGICTTQSKIVKNLYFAGGDSSTDDSSTATTNVEGSESGFAVAAFVIAIVALVAIIAIAAIMLLVGRR